MDRRKVAFVTGSSRGIGAGIAVEFAKAGYDVAVHWRTAKEEAEAVVQLCEAEGAKTALVQGDIACLDDIRRMFDEVLDVFPAIDVQVNNAGITRFAPFLEATPELFEQVNNTDWRGSFFCAQRAARNMAERGTKGLIINISSNHARGNWPIANVYGPVKAALNKFTQNAALELAPHGIRVVCIAPGYTRTREPKPEHKPWVDKFCQRIPLGRFAEPWEIGRACVFLASEAAGYITGVTLEMDGGALLPVVPENRFMPM